MPFCFVLQLHQTAVWIFVKHPFYQFKSLAKTFKGPYFLHDISSFNGFSEPSVIWQHLFASPHMTSSICPGHFPLELFQYLWLCSVYFLYLQYPSLSSLSILQPPPIIKGPNLLPEWSLPWITLAPVIYSNLKILKHLFLYNSKLSYR